jgi:hypothetical protein
MRRLALATAVLGLLGALSSLPTEAAPTSSTVRFVAGSAKAVPATGWSLTSSRPPLSGAAEPTIGVTADGVVFSDLQTKVVRSKDQGRTWEEVTPPGHVTSLDPYLYVDKGTSRVYKSDLAGTCQLLSWSDDRGETWTSAPAACNMSDHQSLTAAKPVSSTTVGYPHVLYSCSQTLGYNGYSMASGCDKSLDGGLTWVPTGTLPFSNPSPYGVGPGSGDSGIDGVCGGNAGQAHAGPDGTLYIARGWCGQPWLAVSRDEGLTWTRTQVAKNGMNTSVSGGFGLVAPGSGQSDHEASVVTDGRGGVYVVWMALDRLPYLAVSRDGGATFGPPLRLSAPGVREAWGPALDVDSRGRLAVAYMASKDSPGAPWTGSYAGTTFTGWVSVVERPLDRAPVVVAGPASAPDAPFVRGACGPGRCNSAVLDFIDVAMGPRGDAWASFVDSAGRRLVVARLTR